MRVSALLGARGSPRARGTRCGSDGDFVPTFKGGTSPERFAAGGLTRLLTHAAARIVLKQLEGLSPRASAPSGAADVRSASTPGDDAARTAASAASKYDVLEAMLAVPMGADAEAWMVELARRDALLAVRVCEARDGYAREGFGWDDLKRVVLEDLQAANEDTLRAALRAQYEPAADADAAGGGGAGW
eukprot:PRCOL_00002086-RA